MFKVGDVVKKTNGLKNFLVTGVKQGWITTNRSSGDVWEQDYKFLLIKNNDALRESIKKFTDLISSQLGEGWQKDVMLDPTDPKFKDVQEKIKEIMKGHYEQHQEETPKEAGTIEGQANGAIEGNESNTSAPEA